MWAMFFLISLISPKICKNFVTDCHQCANLNLGNAGRRCVRPGNNRDSKPTVKTVHTWARRWYISESRFSTRLWKPAEALGEGTSMGRKWTSPRPECTPLSLTWSYAGITPGGFAIAPQLQGLPSPARHRWNRRVTRMPPKWPSLSGWDQRRTEGLIFRNAKRKKEIRRLHSLVIFTSVYYSQRDLCSEDSVGDRQ